jgi:hypothetical protein
VCLHPRQPLGGVAPEQAAGDRIDLHLGEVPLARIPHVDLDRRIDRRDVDQIVRTPARRGIWRRPRRDLWPVACRLLPAACRLFLCLLFCAAGQKRDREHQELHIANATTSASGRTRNRPSTGILSDMPPMAMNAGRSPSA